MKPQRSHTPSNRPAVATDVQESVRRLVMAYGAEHLASETGTALGTIYNKVNPHESSHHKTTLAEAVLWSVLAQRAGTAHAADVLHAFARTLNHVAIPMPDLSAVCDAALLELITKVGVEEGEFFAAVNKALTDRKFSRRDHAAIRREAYEAMAAIAEAVSRIEGMVDE